MFSQPVSASDNPGINQSLLEIAGLADVMAQTAAALIVSTHTANARLTTADALHLARALDSGRSLATAVNALVLNA